MSSGGTAPSRPLASHNLATLTHLETLIKTKPLDHSRLLQLLLAITHEDADNPKLSTHIERVFNLLLMAVLSAEGGEEGAGLPS